MKLVLGLKHNNIYRSLHDFGLKIFSDNGVLKNGKYYHLLEIGSDNHVSLIKTILLVLTTAVAVYMLYPVYSYLRGEREYFWLVYLLGVNRNTVRGYYINITYQLISSMMAFMGIVAADILLHLRIHFSGIVFNCWRRFI